MLSRRTSVMIQVLTGSPLASRSSRTLRGLSLLCIVLIALIWGSTLAVIKDTTANIPFPLFLFIRFSVALLLLSWVRPKRAALLPSAVLGVLLIAFHVTQSLGIHLGSATKSGFLMGLAVIATPLLAHVLFKRRSQPLLYFSAGLVVLSVGLMSAPSWGRFDLSQGDLLVLASALICSLYGVYLVEVARHHDALTLSAMQLYPMVIVSGLWAVPSLGSLRNLSRGDWTALVYLAAVATVLVLLLWTWASRRVAAGEAALICALEPLAGAFFAFLIVGEVPSPSLWYGGSVMLFAILLASFGQLHQTRNKPLLATPNEKVSNSQLLKGSFYEL